MLDSPCTFHEGGTHTVRESQQFKRAFHTPDDPKRPRGDGDRSSSRHCNNNSHDNRRDREDNDRRDDCDVTSSRKTATMSATCLLRQRQATPTARSSRPRGRST
jgi:hypothetical protein